MDQPPRSTWWHSATVPTVCAGIARRSGLPQVRRWSYTRLAARPDRVVVDLDVLVLQAARERAQLGFVTMMRRVGCESLVNTGESSSVRWA